MFTGLLGTSERRERFVMLVLRIGASANIPKLGNMKTSAAQRGIRYMTMDNQSTTVLPAILGWFSAFECKIASDVKENVPLFDLIENLAKCRKYHRKRLSNQS
jgi:hypothetical protein